MMVTHKILKEFLPCFIHVNVLTPTKITLGHRARNMETPILWLVSFNFKI